MPRGGDAAVAPYHSPVPQQDARGGDQSRRCQNLPSEARGDEGKGAALRVGAGEREARSGSSDACAEGFADVICRRALGPPVCRWAWQRVGRERGCAPGKVPHLPKSPTRPGPVPLEGISLPGSASPAQRGREAALVKAGAGRAEAGAEDTWQLPCLVAPCAHCGQWLCKHGHQRASHTLLLVTVCRGAGRRRAAFSASTGPTPSVTVPFSLRRPPWSR